MPYYDIIQMTMGLDEDGQRNEPQLNYRRGDEEREALHEEENGYRYIPSALAMYFDRDMYTKEEAISLFLEKTKSYLEKQRNELEVEKVNVDNLAENSKGDETE